MERRGQLLCRQPLSYSQKGSYMSLLDKLERKFGKYAIPNLMQYIIILYVLGMVLRIATPGVYETYFMLDASQILARTGLADLYISASVAVDEYSVLFNYFIFLLYDRHCVGENMGEFPV